MFCWHIPLNRTDHTFRLISTLAIFRQVSNLMTKHFFTIKTEQKKLHTSFLVEAYLQVFIESNEVL